jgi:protein TonB
MLAYAANAHPVRRAGSPSSLALILAGHAIVIGAVMTAKMDMEGVLPFDPTDVINIPTEPPPPPAPQDPQPRTRHDPQQSFIEQQAPIIDMGRPINTPLDPGPTIEDIGAVIGSGPTIPLDPPKAAPVRMAARFATPDSALRPPYPLDKRRAEEEATLHLKLSIDARGRVVAVDPIGAADPSFLEAARRHILRTWRYRPATEDGVAVPSSTVINLSFRLEDV